MNVYLVEDAVGIRNAIRISVEDAGGTVIGETGSQIKAVYDMARLAPDVAIVDLRLEEGNGLGVIRQVKKLLPDLVIIVMTSQEQSQLEKICLESGANYFFEKSSQHYGNFECVLRELSTRYEKPLFDASLFAIDDQDGADDNG